MTVPGGRIRVKPSEVELCCDTLEEVYRQRCARLTLADARDHIDLARWCQQQGLVGFANQELAWAESLEPEHPLIPLMRRRLEMSQSPPTGSVPSTETADAPPSFVDLDLMVRGMPPGTVETFAQTVQPLLMNSCAAAGCHGPGSETDFRVLRVAPGRPPSRRLTQRNLHAALSLIDREDPAASRLLAAPIRPHGSARAAVFTDRNLPQYQRLVDWVCQVAEAAEPAADATPATHVQPDEPPVETVPAVLVAPDRREVGLPAEPALSWAQQFEQLGLDTENPLPTDAPTPASPVDPKPKVQRGATVPGFVPKDPFDPETFNRRFFRR